MESHRAPSVVTVKRHRLHPEASRNLREIDRGMAAFIETNPEREAECTACRSVVEFDRASKLKLLGLGTRVLEMARIDWSRNISRVLDRLELSK